MRSNKKHMPIVGNIIRKRVSSRKTPDFAGIKPNYAYIDAQNLYMSLQGIGWKIDYVRFRKFLRVHHNVEKAYLFMGYREAEQQMYTFLQSAGFEIIFKPVLELPDGSVKGNCDAELVMQVMLDKDKYHQAVIVTGDGDFYSLVKHLHDERKLRTILAPSWHACSSLLTDGMLGQLTWLSNMRRQLQYLPR